MKQKPNFDLDIFPDLEKLNLYAVLSRDPEVEPLFTEAMRKCFKRQYPGILRAIEPLRNKVGIRTPEQGLLRLEQLRFCGNLKNAKTEEQSAFIENLCLDSFVHEYLCEKYLQTAPIDTPLRELLQC